MPEQGRLTDWNDERGFGYIKPLDGGPTVFVHISELPRDQRRPRVTDLLTYETGIDDRGRTRAVKVRFLSAAHSRSPLQRNAMSLPSSTLPAIVMATLFALALCLVAGLGAIGWIVPAVYAAMSLVAFAAYGQDKLAAERGDWRTGEGTLILLGLLCGWPGAFVAQEVFRHKTKKQPFRAIFWASVAANVALLVWLTVSPPLVASS